MDCYWDGGKNRGKAYHTTPRMAGGGTNAGAALSRERANGFGCVHAKKEL